VSPAIPARTAMKHRLPLFLLLATLAVALSGCSTLHGWAQLGSNHPAQAGASVSVPVGK